MAAIPFYVSYQNGSGVPTLIGNTLAKNGTHNGLGIVGTIAQDMTIPEDYPIVLVAEQRSGQMTIAAGTTVTLSQGTILKVRPDQEGVNTGTEVIVYGTLNSLGTATHPVYITALADDSVGGDTNGDGGASSPSPGRWTYLIASGTAAQLNLFTQQSPTPDKTVTSPRGSVRVHNGAKLSMDQSVVHSNASYSIYATSGSTITIPTLQSLAVRRMVSVQVIAP